jgi:integrase
MAKSHRRAHGEGALFLLANGRWAGEIDLGTVNGKRQRRRVQAKTQAEAREKLKALQAALAEGRDTTSDRLTVETHLHQWLAKIKQTRTPNTYAVYEQASRLYLLPALGSIRLPRLTVAHVEAVLFQMAADGNRLAFIRSVKAALSIALRDAERRHLLSRNVAALATLPAATTPPRPRRALGPDDARRLLDAIGGDRFEVALLVMLSLGLRRGECFALRWDDLDLDRLTLRVAGNLQWVEGQWQVRPTKTKGSSQTLPIPPALARRLADHRDDQRAAFADADPPPAFVFITAAGGPVPERTFSQHFARLLKAKGLPPLSPHELRHSCATILFAQGVDPKLIQAILRHSRIGITMDTYSHLLPGMTAAALGEMNALLAAPEPKTDESNPSAED